jgi:hypothetical protein
MVRRILAVITGVALFGAVAAYLGVFIVDHTALNADFYQEVTNKTEIEEFVHYLASQQLPEAVEQELAEQPMTAGMLSPEARILLANAASDALLQAADPAWIGTQITGVSAALIPWVRGDSSFSDYTIEITPIIQESRVHLIENLQGFSDSELASLYMRRSGIAMTVNMLFSAINFPETVSLSQIISEFGSQEEIEESVYDIRRSLAFGKYIPVLIIVLAAVLILLSGFFRGLLYSGAAGFLAGIPFLAGVFGLRLMWTAERAAQQSGMPVSLIHDFAVLFTDTILTRVLAVFAFSLVVLTVGAVFSMKKTDQRSRR